MPGNSERPRIVIIVGPTASGKSRLALRLAQSLDGEIISADSMQVYRHMDIGTAKPSLEERSIVRHHLIDVVDPDEEFNAAQFLALASSAIAEITGKGRHVFMAGGTGLYIRVLTGGLIGVPGPSGDFRAQLREEMALFGKQRLHEKLRQLDPVSAGRIHPNDAVRMIRALEALALTGEPISEMQQEHGFRERNYGCLKIGLAVDRPELYRMIDRRCRDMMENGLVEETERLLQMGYGEELKPMQALGYRRVVDFLKGRCKLEEALERISTDTRHYARRQLTWFRRDAEVRWHHPDDAEIESEIKDFLAN